ncbi:hypothetical protein LZC95_41060 [Pendulispora brunnea]|uniref:Uncharacterized protein n=1 Tax=Pendulispora brunnea TaxID=2905690 RepID=A0ABZ2K8Y3_9BACT
MPSVQAGPKPSRPEPDHDSATCDPESKPPTRKHPARTKIEKQPDHGYDESHGYGPGHGGPTGPGDAPGNAQK